MRKQPVEHQIRHILSLRSAPKDVFVVVATRLAQPDVGSSVLGASICAEERRIELIEELVKVLTTAESIVLVIRDIAATSRQRVLEISEYAIAGLIYGEQCPKGVQGRARQGAFRDPSLPFDRSQMVEVSQAIGAVLILSPQRAEEELTSTPIVRDDTISRRHQVPELVHLCKRRIQAPRWIASVSAVNSSPYSLRRVERREIAGTLPANADETGPFEI